MKILKENIGNYIFYIIPEEQLKKLLYRNAEEYITLYQNDWED